jgi:hypothetical protein
MKQLVLLLLIAASALSVSAQKDYRDENRNDDNYDRGRYEDRRDRNEDKYDRNDRRDERNSSYDKYDKHRRQELRRRLDIVNRDYDSRINSVRRNPFMRSRVKARRIEELEYQRRVALDECRSRFSRQRDYAGEDKYYKRGR